MRKIFLLLFICSYFGANAQYTPFTSKPQYPYIKIDSGLAIPFNDTSAITFGTLRPGTIRCRPADSTLYMWNGNKWDKYIDKGYTDSAIAANINNVPVITATNGLTKTGNDIRLGGDLTKNTTVLGADNYGLNFSNLSTFQLYRNGPVSQSTIFSGNDKLTLSTKGKTSLSGGDFIADSAYSFIGFNDIGSGYTKSIYVYKDSITIHGLGTSNSSIDSDKIKDAQIATANRFTD